MQRIGRRVHASLLLALGFLPMALSRSGGLVSVTLLTLLVLPTVYAWIEERVAR